MTRIVQGPLITGEVVNKKTFSPLAGVVVTPSKTVYADSEMNVPITSVTTNALGVFTAYALVGSYSFTTTSTLAGPIEAIQVTGTETPTGIDLPPLTGNAGNVLTVTNDETAVEWETPTSGTSGSGGGGTGLEAKVVATTNLALSGKPTIDGYATQNSDIILLVGQTTTSQNGLWQVPAVGTGSWARPTQFPSAGAITGAVCGVNTGTVYGGSLWVLEAASTVTIDTTAQTWASEYQLAPNTPPAHAGQVLASAGSALNAPGEWVDRIIPVNFGITGLISNWATAGVVTGQIAYEFEEPATFKTFRCRLGTVGNDATLTVDILKNGTSIYNVTPANRPTFPASSSPQSELGGTPDTLTVAAGDYLTVNIAYTGTAAKDLSVMLRYAATS